MATSSNKIKQRALNMVHFEAFVNLPFLDAGIISMFTFYFLEMFQHSFKFEGHQTLTIKDKSRSLAKFNLSSVAPGML